MSIERVDRFFNRRIIDENFESSSANKRLNCLKNNVNSFINDIIGDGVDRMSEIITAISTDQNKQKKLKIDNQLSRNSGNNFQQNLDFIKQQHQCTGFIFEKQSRTSMFIILYLYIYIYHLRLEKNITNYSRWLQ
jgi:hypothetical protein